MSHHDQTVDELRGWTRFTKERGTDFAVICRPQTEEMLVEVHDESLAGLGVHVKDVEPFVVGREFDIVYAGEYFAARVAHVESHEDGGYLVGFACDREPALAHQKGGQHEAVNVLN